VLRVRSFTDIVLGDPVGGRVCGACVACCSLLEIDTPSLKKTPGRLCPHCTGQGCGVYDERPSPCRTYFCAWRRIAALGEETRPDRLGLMLHLAHPKPAPNPLMHVYISLQPLTSWAEVRPGGLKTVMAVLRTGALPVWRFDRGEEQLLHPSPAVARIVLRGGQPRTRRVASEAEQWVLSQAAYAQGPWPAPPYGPAPR